MILLGFFVFHNTAEMRSKKCRDRTGNQDKDISKQTLSLLGRPVFVFSFLSPFRHVPLSRILLFLSYAGHLPNPCECQSSLFEGPKAPGSGSVVKVVRVGG